MKMTEYQERGPQGQTNTMAIISLIAGIIGLVILLAALCVPLFLFFSLLVGSVGILLGAMAKKRIDESQGAQSGRGLAIAGLVTGLISGVISLILIIIYIAVVGFIFAGSALYPLLEGGY
jgi:hypothetical protein